MDEGWLLVPLKSFFADYYEIYNTLFPSNSADTEWNACLLESGIWNNVSLGILTESYNSQPLRKWLFLLPVAGVRWRKIWECMSTSVRLNTWTRWELYFRSIINEASYNQRNWCLSAYIVFLFKCRHVYELYQKRCVNVTCKSQLVTWPACTSSDFTWQRGSVRSYITFSKGFPASDCYKLASDTFYLHSRHLPYFWRVAHQYTLEV